MSTRRSELDQSRRYGVVHGECWYRSEQDGKKFGQQCVEILNGRMAEDVADHQSKNYPPAIKPMRRSAAAERMRRTRERRCAGIIALVSLEIRQQDLDRLVARYLISPDESDDRKKIATAIRRALENWCQI